MALNHESNSHAAPAGAMARNAPLILDMIMAVKHSYSISCWNESHSFAIDDVDTSCLGHVTGLKKVTWKTC